jgi:hypothetical protein
MIKKGKQNWAVGALVKVGFVAGLEVLAIVSTPGNFAPDAYLLTRNEQFYSFVPHNGLTKIAEFEARKMVAEAKKQAAAAAAEAIAKAVASARHATLVAELVGA